jgi:hypothetical protein
VAGTSKGNGMHFTLHPAKPDSPDQAQSKETLLPLHALIASTKHLMQLL